MIHVTHAHKHIKLELTDKFEVFRKLNFTVCNTDPDTYPVMMAKREWTIKIRNAYRNCFGLGFVRHRAAVESIKLLVINLNSFRKLFESHT